jgi:hypothetical protein
MKRLVVAIIVVAATMALAPSVASAGKVAPERVAPGRVAPMPAKPAFWKAMWLTRQHPAPVSLVAPMPALQRAAALRLSPAKLAILKISTQAR